MTTPETLNAEETILCEGLTPAQRTVLETSTDRLTTHSGRGGWSAHTMRAMEKKGLVTQGRVSTHETHWRFTPVALKIGKLLVGERRARFAAAENPGLILQDGVYVEVKLARTETLKSRYHSVSAQGAHGVFIAKELELRGWQAPRSTSQSLEWIRIKTPEFKVVEHSSSVWSYHARDVNQPNVILQPAVCGKGNMMITEIPLNFWGMQSDLHEKWCAVCAARAELPLKK